MEKRRRREDIASYRETEQKRQRRWRKAAMQRTQTKDPPDVSRAQTPVQVLEIQQEISEMVAQRLRRSRAQINRDLRKMLNDMDPLHWHWGP